MADDAVSQRTGDAVLERLGLGRAPAPTVGGLHALYRAWCMHVPFDNVRKRLAMVHEQPGRLPGGDAEDLFQAYLRDGVGGTCWPSSNALYAIVRFCGFHARRVSASMMEGEDENHGSVVVTIDGAEYVVDSSLLTNVPVQLQSGVRTEVYETLHETIVEPAGDTWRLETQRPLADMPIAFRVLHDPVDHGRYLDRYEWSRGVSPFNARLYATRNVADSVVTLLGDQRFTKTVAGVEGESLAKPRRREALVEQFGYSPAIADALLAIEAD